MNEKNGLEYYKEFIDNILSRSECMTCRWIRERNEVTRSDEKAYLNDFLHSLNAEQKACLCELLQEAKVSGIHEVLAYLDEEMDCEGMVISKCGVPLEYDRFESMHYDFIARSEGDAWPE